MLRTLFNVVIAGVLAAILLFTMEVVLTYLRSFAASFMTAWRSNEAVESK